MFVLVEEPVCTVTASLHCSTGSPKQESCWIDKILDVPKLIDTLPSEFDVNNQVVPLNSNVAIAA